MTHLPRTLLLLPAFAGVALSAPQVVADGAAAPASEPGPVRELMSIRTAPLENCLSHPKDRGLLAALRLVDDRMAELPGEVPDFPPLDPAMIGLMTDVALGAKTIRMFVDPSIDISRDMPFSGYVALHAADADGAARLAARILGALEATGAPEFEKNDTGRSVLPAPFPITFGAEGSDVVLDLRGTRPTPLPMTDPLLPQGAHGVMALRYDYGAMLDMMMVTMEAQGQGMQADMIYDVVSRFGLDQFVLEVTAAADAERSYTVVRMPGWGAKMTELGLMPETTLAPADLAVIPRDATWASVQKADFAGTFDVLVSFAQDMMEQQGQSGDPVEMIASMTGFDLRADFFEVLGGTLGAYASDTTGGGGLLSMVMFASLRDAETALETRERVEEMMNSVAMLQAEGYVQMRPWTREGVEYSTLTFPGLPVPLEPTIAITDGWMFVGASPNAALAAVAQSQGGGPSLNDRAEFRDQLASGLDGLSGVSFQDTARLARDGYSAMSMGAAALANAVRSRTDASRDAGQVLPSFGDLIAGAKPTVSISHAAGDDWVVESRGDASMAVQLTALCGWLQSTGLALALPAALAGGVITEQNVGFEAPSDF